jgi:hypothetical protein
MSLFNQASLVVTPNGYKAGKLYSIKPTSGAGDLDVVRATGATRVNASGLIETVGNNVPRLDYPPLGGCPSILVEPQRTNLVFPSDVATTQTRTVTAVAHTLSFYGTGTVVLSGVAIATLSGTGANNRVTLTFTPTAGSLILTVTGSVLDWQLEVGANATSYIPTIASTVTRNTDVISKTGISDLIGQTEGTLYFEGNLTANTTTIASLRTDGGALNGVIIDFHTDDRIRAYIVENNAGRSLVSGLSTITFNSFIKIAYVYKSGNSSLFINGVKQNTSNQTFTFNNTLLRLNIDFTGYNYGSLQGKTKYVKSVLVFPTQLTDTQAIQLTTL